MCSFYDPYPTKKLSQVLGIPINAELAQKFIGLQRKSPKEFKSNVTHDHGHIYPKYFAPIIVNGQIEPAQYGLLPNEKYSTHNARVENLYKKATWQKVFGKQHCLVPIKNFYEYDKNKKVFGVTSVDNKPLLALGVYIQNKDFKSFTMITRPAPMNIADKGHDRCPLFVDIDFAFSWNVTENATRSHLIETARSHEVKRLFVFDE